MTTGSYRYKLIIIIALVLFPLVSTSEEKNNDKKNKDNGIVITTKDPDFTKALIIGESDKTITNPRSVSFKKLMENSEDYQIALKAEKDKMPGKFSIFEVKATEYVKKLIKEYTDKNGIQFVIEETIFFKFLKSMPDFEGKTDEELRKKFDITNDIIQYDNKKKEAQKEEEKKAKKKQEPVKLFWEDLFPNQK